MPAKPPQHLATPEVLLPLPAVEPSFARASQEPVDLMTVVKACNGTRQSQELLKSSLYHHIYPKRLRFRCF